MIIDIHGHYTTEPKALSAFRDRQLAGLADPARQAHTADLNISDEELIQSVQPQLKLQSQRGCDLTLFSPRASGMAHHIGSEAISAQWTTVSNNLIHRICTLLPDHFAGVGQLPQFRGAPPKHCIPELERIVNELGFVAVNLNPDPSGGYWTDLPLTDHQWYPLYEKLCELNVPAMIHVSSCCNPNFHHTGAHYINADTTAFMQLIQGDLFKDFPALKLVIPHGGGAVPYHWGRYRGLCQAMRNITLADHLMDNVFFDTCVYHLPGIELLAKVIPVNNILFASEMLGAVKGIDPETGHNFDDTKRYLDQLTGLDEQSRHKIFEGNARRVYPRLDALLAAHHDRVGREAQPLTPV
ncbi:MAG: amidohydrolase [Burkholderiaceae bacterium]|nr:MAG: amidohydrolase [Burkholderiaceae bacterium]TAM04123.1 MAG: amidohydrolase [Pusillimonas sp.]